LTLSVVIPTYNRKARLHRVLEALACQVDGGEFEVVVVSDGSTDETDQYLRSGATPLAVVAVTQDNAGPAAARNRGVQTARGDIVLFIDDDVVPAPDLVHRHRAAHELAPDDIVLIGPMLNPPDAEYSPWVAWEQHQLYKQYEAMEAGDWQPTFRQFFTGNASVPRSAIVEVGLFDTTFRRAEDVELAFRLHRAGVRFQFEPAARAHHYAERSLQSWLAMAEDYGRNDVTFMRSGQEWLTGTVADEFFQRNRLVRAVVIVGATRPRFAGAARRVLRLLGTARPLPATINRLALSGLYAMTYYGGMADGLGSGERLRRLLQARGTVDRPNRFALVLEQTLGHVTHSKNLESLITDAPGRSVAVLPVPFELSGWSARIPGMRNWTVRAGVRARRAIGREHRRHGIDALFIHSQVPAILVGRWMKKIPTVVSLDATPLQYDQLGEFYAHERSSPRVEAWKKTANIRCFRRARHVVTWSAWAREGLVAEYGVDAGKITVVPPGVHVERWERGARGRPEAGAGTDPVRVLFVGGDLDRKGGHLLIEACRTLRKDPAVGTFELHLVTHNEVADEPGITVHNGLGPNSPVLIELYHSSQVFCLPTLGDCLPMVLSEAGVAGMALISTDVGAIREIVRHDVTGLLIPPGDVDALEAALRRLINDPDLRRRLGSGAEALVRREYDASVNAGVVVDLLRRVTGRADADE
jgi:glycosyltransferase involved in cell wall biosynthesis/GT2 family glycosyltransferase